MAGRGGPAEPAGAWRGVTPASGSRTGRSEVLAVRVTPRAARNRLLGFRPVDGSTVHRSAPAARASARASGAFEEILVVQVTAPPEGGRANRALVVLLARSAGVPRRAIELIAGERSRNKLVRVPAGTTASLRRVLAGC